MPCSSVSPAESPPCTAVCLGTRCHIFMQMGSGFQTAPTSLVLEMPWSPPSKKTPIKKKKPTRVQTRWSCPRNAVPGDAKEVFTTETPHTAPWVGRSEIPNGLRTIKSCQGRNMSPQIIADWSTINESSITKIKQNPEAPLSRQVKVLKIWTHPEADGHAYLCMERWLLKIMLPNVPIYSEAFLEWFQRKPYRKHWWG